MFTPHTVVENATPDANEVLVTGVDAQGVPQNVLLRDAAALRAKLSATPPMIINPERAAVEAEAFAAAVAHVEAEVAKAAAATAEPTPEPKTDSKTEPTAENEAASTEL